MTYNSIKHLSFSLSLLIHLILLGLFLLIKISLDYQPKEYVELTFGTSGEIGSSGAIGTQIKQIEEVSKPQPKNQTETKNLEVKEVNLPKAKNTSEDNEVKPADKEKEIAEKNKSRS